MTANLLYGSVTFNPVLEMKVGLGNKLFLT